MACRPEGAGVPAMISTALGAAAGIALIAAYAIVLIRSKGA